jgi:hypothetical protein
MKRSLAVALAAAALLVSLAVTGPAGAQTIPTPPGGVPRGTAIGGDLPVVGDWNGGGTTTVGVRRGATWFLKNVNSTGVADVSFDYGLATDWPIAGDWDGDGTTTVGVRRGATFYLRNTNSTGQADISVDFGLPDDTPVVGDWDGNGTVTIGVFRRGAWYLRNANTAGPADISVVYGVPGDQPMVGDWDGDGTTTIGIRRPCFCIAGRADDSNPSIHMSNSNTSPADAGGFFPFGWITDAGLAGDWDGNGTDTVGVRRGITFHLLSTGSNIAPDTVFDYGLPTITATGDPHLPGGDVPIIPVLPGPFG